MNRLNHLNQDRTLKVNTLKWCDITQIYSIIIFTLRIFSLNFRFSPPLKYTSQPRVIFADPKTQFFLKFYIRKKFFHKVQIFQKFFPKKHAPRYFGWPQKFFGFLPKYIRKKFFHKVQIFQNFSQKNMLRGILADPKRFFIKIH